MKTVSFSGDLGDTIYLLPSLRAMGGAHLRLISSPGIVREPFTQAKVESLWTLARLQPYILSCEFAPKREPGWIDADAFRANYYKGRTIVEWAANGLGIGDKVSFDPWLRVDEPTPVARVVIHRTDRYQNPSFPWWDVPIGFQGRIVMVGSPAEHDTFCREHSQAPIPYHPTYDLVSLARVIAGSELFIGNQSAPMAVALGLGAAVVQEVCDWTPNCRIPGRRNAQYVRQGSRVCWPRQLV